MHVCSQALLDNTTDIGNVTAACPGPSTSTADALAAADQALVRLGEQMTVVQAYNLRAYTPLAFNGKLTSMLDTVITMYEHSVNTLNSLG